MLLLGIIQACMGMPWLERESVLLRLLARSATGQEITSYTTFFTGPRRGDDVDGPEQFHVVLVDNGCEDDSIDDKSELETYGTNPNDDDSDDDSEWEDSEGDED